MIDDDIYKEYEKINREHRIARWFYLFGGIFLVAFSFYTIGNPSFEKLRSLGLGTALAPIGGTMIGYTMSVWSGTKAHRLLARVLNNAKT